MTVVATTAAAAPAQRTTTEIQAIEPRATRPESPPATKPTAPTVDLTTFLAVRHDKLKQITDAQIAKLRRLLAVTQDDALESADLLLSGRASASASSISWPRSSSRSPPRLSPPPAPSRRR